MQRMNHQRPPGILAAALVMASLLAWPASGAAQLGGQLPAVGGSPSAVTGQATAAQVVVLGLLGTATTSTLASTGVSSINSESDVGQASGSVPSLLNAETLSAATYSYANEVVSEASLENLGMTVAGIEISADSIIARASQASGAAGTGLSTISNLAINGVPVDISGAPNQAVAIPGGQLVINEQTISSDGTAVVNALHVTVNGVADVVIASAKAGIS